MMFLRCFILLSFIVAYGSAEPSKVNKNIGKNGPPTKAKQRIPEEYQPPSFCNGLECPKYRLLKKYPGFEHREYDATKWVSTPVTFNEEGIGASYTNLFQYINGSNSAGKHLSITTPLVLLIPLGNGEPEKGTMSMFLSANLRNPPMPLKPNHSLQSYPKASLYVKSFSGNGKEEDFQENARALARELMDLCLDYDQSFCACNIYDSPNKLSNRHVEVWFLAAQD